MAKAIRVMTFNVQLLPWLARQLGNAPLLGSPGGGGPDELSPGARANAVATAILTLPLRSQPDIVVFNEVFDEAGRKTLLRRLKGRYPHFIKKLEHPSLDLEEDSGLMLFSKRPLLTLPNGDNHWFKPYPKAAGDDALVAKGVGIVRVAGPFDPTTIAFTHLQASYDEANTEHADVRAAQLQFIHDALAEVCGGSNTQAFTNTVIVGDFNVKGDPDETSGEWGSVFANVPGMLGGAYMDQWRQRMHPPGDLRDHDPGYTHRSTTTYAPSRLDYQLAWRSANADVGLAAQHMCVPFVLPSEITDHWPLYAHIHKVSPHGSPDSAVDLLQQPADNGALPGSQVWTMETRMREEDMHHWVFVRDAGTFSVWPDEDLEVHAFRFDNFSAELSPSDVLKVAELPDSIKPFIQRSERRLETGQVFAWRDPFYLRLRGKLQRMSGRRTFKVIRHRGESPATAIELLPHRMTPSDLPQGQPLGQDDRCWFRAERPDRYSQTPYDDHFMLRNPDGIPVKVTMLDAAQQEAGQGANDSAVEIPLSRAGGAERLYLVTQRGSFASGNVSVTWSSPLTYLALDETLRIHVEDETGPDWPGSDELELDVSVDGEPLLADTWTDADAGENFPSLAKSLKDNARARQGHDRWVAFSDAVEFSVLKLDGVFAHGSAVALIPRLSQYDSNLESRRATIVVKDPVGDGTLTVHASISRFPMS